MIEVKKLKEGKYYLVKVNEDYSESGYDIAEYRRGKLISQTNGEYLPSNCKCYTLP